MASTNFSITHLGIRQGKETVVVNTTGTDLSTDAVRVIIDHDNVTSREEALLALDVLRMKIMETTWPPA